MPVAAQWESLGGTQGVVELVKYFRPQTSSSCLDNYGPVCRSTERGDLANFTRQRISKKSPEASNYISQLL